MINLFELVNGVPVPSVHCKTLKTLRQIEEIYPEDYLKIYQFLFYMTCPDEDFNPFFRTDPADKEEMILDQIEATFSTEDDPIQEGLAFCEKMFSTETSRAYNGIAQMMDTIASYMKTTTTLTDGKDGNIGQIRAMAKDFNAIRLSFKETYRDLKDEQQSKVRGGKRLSYDQDD